MAHNIDNERIVLYRTPGWHELGTVLQDKFTCAEGLKIAKCDFEIQKYPMLANIEINGVSMLMPVNQFALVRDPRECDSEYQFLGTCGSDYGIIQNSHIANLLDETLAKKWNPETIGSLGKGETIFFTLDAGMMEIGGEEIHNYFLVTDSKNGKTALKVVFTPVRVVCQNTLMTALKSSTVNLSLKHYNDVSDSLELTVNAIDLCQQSMTNVKAWFDAFTNTAIDENDWEYIRDTVYSMPSKSSRMILTDGMDTSNLKTNLGAKVTQAREHYDYMVNRSTELRSLADQLFNKFNDEQPSLAMTGWAGYNAITELADHRTGRDKAYASIFGARVKEKTDAFACVQQLVK